IYTIILSLIFLQEKITGFVALGAVFMLTGAFLITQEKKSFTGEIKKKFSRDEVKGILFALGAALCWGITPVLIKPAVEESGSAVVGTLAAYLAAAVIIVIMLGDRTRRKRLTGLSLRKNMLLMAVAGIFTAAGQLLYFTSLERSPANVIAPLMSIQLLFIFLLSYFINRRIELFSLKVALGIGATVAGTILLFQ
ncbi:MAG: DMT family transporter, partial [Candidatus Omnitrophota bacterium]